MASYIVRHMISRCKVISNKHTLRCSPVAVFLSTSTFPNISKNIRMYSSINDKFEDSKLKLKTITEEPSDDIKLKLYSLFKQATIGSCNVSKPSVLDFVGRAKWDAWNSLGSMTQDEAKEKYATLIDELSAGGKSNSPSSANKSTGDEQAYLLVTKKDNVTKITLNRPAKMNALTPEMYDGIVQALNTAANDDTTIVVLTGNGDYYCSGNDLTNFAKGATGNIPEIAKSSKELLQRFVGSFIDFPKLLIAAINGPAVGISVTVLGLCDIVYATDKATFHTPFSKIGQSPEGCSSYIFPRLMGQSKATEMLLFNKKITAAEALERNLVSEVFPENTFATEIESRIQEMLKLPKNSLLYSKKLSRDFNKETLHQVNKAECERLMERWQSPDCMNAVMAFLQRRSKV